MIKAGVIGYPIDHSKSPLIHGYWIEKYGCKASYEAIACAPETLEEDIKNIVKQGFKGFNVTVPHKESLLSLCNSLDETARAIGAVNTVVIDSEAKLRGYNTDAQGFVTNIQVHAPHFSFQKGPALVLGAGGASRAVIYGLLQQDVPEIFLSNRTREKAEKIKSDFGQDKIHIVEWNEKEKFLLNSNLLVNATLLGMENQKPLELNLQDLPQETLVTDIVYTPLMTNLLVQAKNNGNPIVTGIGMLLYQACPAFEKWFGIAPEVTQELESKITQ